MYPRRSPFNDESVLTERLRQQDERAFKWLYTHYSVSLLVNIIKVVHDREQAHDLLQDVFIKIWQNLDKYDASKGRLFTWMSNVARYTAIDAIRAGKTRCRPATTQLLSLDAETSSVIDQQHWVPAINPDHLGLHQVIARLRPQHQELVQLVYLHGYTQEEAATELAMPVGTVKTRLRVALRLLKGHF